MTPPLYVRNHPLRQPKVWEKTCEKPQTSPIATPSTVYTLWASILSSALQSLPPPTMQNKYEVEKSGVKRLCNVLGYFIIKGRPLRSNQQPSHFIDSNQSLGTHSTNIYGAPTICQALRTRWWSKQPQCMIWWDCIIPHQRRQTSPTITLSSILVHPAGLANNLVFLLREFRNQWRVLSRGNDILRSSGQEAVQTLALQSSRGVTRKWLLVTQCYYILQQGACCDSLMGKQSSNASGQSVREMMPRGGKRTHRKDTK